MNSYLFIWTIITFAFFALGSGQSFNQSRELLQTVLKNYERRLRPNLNQSQPTVVHVLLNLLNINDFDEIKSKFSVTGYLFSGWKDELINWNPDNNHGIEYLDFPVNDVWYPKFVLTYNHGKLGSPAEDWMSVKIMANGAASFLQGDVYNSICSADVTYFPFDFQICDLVFVTWVTTDKAIQIETTVQFVIGDHFQNHGEWEIIDNSSIARYPEYTTVTFRFTLRRKPLFYVVNIILPIIIMSLLSILVFVLPPQSGERVSYSITVLLAIAVFLTIVGEHLPKTSNPTAVLSYFLMVNLITSALTCVCTIINLQIYFRDNTTPMPAWTKLVVRFTTCAKPRTAREDITQTGKNSAKPTQECNPNINADKDAQRDDVLGTTWADVSQSMDRICILFFLIVTVTNFASFAIFVSQNESAYPLSGG